MNKKLIAALVAGAFAFASASAMADDKTPSAPVDQATLKAEKANKKAARPDDQRRPLKRRLTRRRKPTQTVWQS